MRKLLEISVLVSCVSAIGCSGKGGTSAAAGGSSKIQSTAPVCTQPPNKQVQVDYDEIGGDSTRGPEGAVLAQTPGSFVCGHQRGEDVAGKPEMALLIGNLLGLAGMEKDVLTLSAYWVGAAAGSHRRGCIYMVSPENLARLAANPNLQHLVMIGHGSNGNLVGLGGDTISADSIPTFVGTNLRQVSFYSCQAGQKLSTWRRIFGQSKAAVLDFSTENVRVDKAITQLGDKIGDYWQCKL